MADEIPPRKRRSGSEKRKRPVKRWARFSQAEDDTLAENARRAGITVSAYIRYCTINVKPPRGTRHPSVEVQAVVKLLAQLGKIGSNINQIAHHANAGRPMDRMEDRLDLALRDLVEMRLACMQALGYERDRKTSDREPDDPESL